MKGRLASQRGMSLVEATIILMVLAILTSVIAPSMGDYVEDARNVKAKEDVEAIGTAILRLVRDTGLGCLSIDATPTSTACDATNKVELVYSNGSNPTVTAEDYTMPAGAGADATINWRGDAQAPTVQDEMDDQLVQNDNATPYVSASFTLGGGPKQGLGWRGAYLTGPIGPDPWGFTYQSNTVFLLPNSEATAGTGNGQRSGGWFNDVIVISGGPNGTIQTEIADDTSNLDGTVQVGDDVIYVVTGSSR